MNETGRRPEVWKYNIFLTKKTFLRNSWIEKNHNILFKAVLYATLTPLKLFKNCWKFFSKFLKISGVKNFKKKFSAQVDVKCINMHVKYI